MATERRLEAWAWLVTGDAGVQTSQGKEKKGSVEGQGKGNGRRKMGGGCLVKEKKINRKNVIFVNQSLNH